MWWMSVLKFLKRRILNSDIFGNLASLVYLVFLVSLVFLVCLVEKIETLKQVQNDNVIIQNQESSIECNDSMTNVLMTKYFYPSSSDMLIHYPLIR